MGEDELAAAYGLAQELARWASSAIRDAVGNVTAARTKRHAADWVTQTDEYVERSVRARLLAAFPEHRVVGEEQRGSGAFLNDTPITARSQPSLTGDLVLTELGGRGARDAIRSLVPWLAQQHAILRVMGSSALSMAAVGAGRAGALVLHRFQPWDVIAATAICREAGAVVEDGHGRRQGVPEQGLVAGHAEVVARLWGILRAQPTGVGG